MSTTSYSILHIRRFGHDEEGIVYRAGKQIAGSIPIGRAIKIHGMLEEWRLSCASELAAESRRVVA